MVWDNNRFLYSLKLLYTIGENYENIYDGLAFNTYVETDLFSLAEYRADFALATRHLGRRKRRFIWLVVEGYEAKELEQMGFYEPERLMRQVIGEMRVILNGGE